LATLWAVHISDGVLQWPWLVGGFLLAILLGLWGSRRLRDEEIPRIAVMSSAFFVASLIHVRVLGTSVHLLLNGLVGIILGPRVALSIPLGLLLQTLLFAHGGLTALGVNCCVMEIPALLAWWAFGRLKATPWFQHPRPRWMIGFAVGGLTVLVTVTLNALTLWLGGVANWPELAVVIFLAHWPIAAVEALIMASTVGFLARVKPEMLGVQTLTPATTQPPEEVREGRQAG
jgi:cobalt/nickel transport system permease protein